MTNHRTHQNAIHQRLSIKGTTKLLGIIGDPVEHSFSPAMHNAAIAYLGVDYAYVPLPVSSNQLTKALTGFEAIGLQGFNITIPHKQAIIPLLDTVSDTAQAIGAVNTVWRTETGWHGTNTDMDGFLAPLKQMEREWSMAKVLVLGNGGAARAVVAGCINLGCASVHVVGRNPDKLVTFQQSWQGTRFADHLDVAPWETLNTLIPQADLVVNTTPLGMTPNINASPLSSENAKLIRPNTVAYDLIYTPSPTVFMQQAIDQGAIALDGLEMLVEQGAAALNIWLQQPVPIDVMRIALSQQLSH